MLHKKGAIIPSFEMMPAEEVYNEPVKQDMRQGIYYLNILMIE